MNSEIIAQRGRWRRVRLQRKRRKNPSLVELLSQRDLRDRVFLGAVVLMSYSLWLLHGSRDFIGAGSQAGSGLVLAEILWLVAYVAAFFGIVMERRRALEVLRASLPMVLYLLVICASAVWSEQPLLSARRSFELLGTSALGLYFVSRLGLRAFTQTLAVALGISATLSILFIALVPSLGFEQDAFAGSFSSKNELGPAMVLGIVTIICLAGTYGKRPIFTTAAIIMFLLLLAGSKNAAGIVSAAVLTVMVPALFRSRMKRSVKFLALFVLGLAAVIFWGTALGVDLDDVLGIFGRDSTFTGRTQVWQDVASAIGDRPLLGYGYAAFWGVDGPAARLVYSDVHWAPASAHNGFIEVALGMGFLGESILLLLLAVGLWRGFLMFWRGQDLLSAWPLLATVYVILSNFSGATFDAVGNTIDFLVLAAAFFYSAEANVRHRERELTAKGPTLRGANRKIAKAAY